MASAAENIIVLGTYHDPVAAHLARTRLEAAGIGCFLSNESLVSLNVMYSPAAGGVRLHVYARDATRAAEVLRERPHMYAQAGGPVDPASAAAALACPRCGSADVRHEASAQPRAGQRWATIRGWLRRQGLLHEPESHCFGCGYDF